MKDTSVLSNPHTSEALSTNAVQCKKAPRHFAIAREYLPKAFKFAFCNSITARSESS
ncbi:hypothetical protein [Helicobacter burdigaliensis]|uniref:hypothetical protein n=1 Tax=Helicobacter burdigaliensis TaxID=2315334 RepID=UPI0018E50323|nr:hypothetical protein [Helicobacter burdigaliensis]